mgnify:CR=1 FL=1
MTVEIQIRRNSGELCAICREPLGDRVLVQTDRSGLETLWHVECGRLSQPAPPPRQTA